MIIQSTPFIEMKRKVRSRAVNERMCLKIIDEYHNGQIGMVVVIALIHSYRFIFLALWSLISFSITDVTLKFKVQLTEYDCLKIKLLYATLLPRFIK